MESGDAKPSLTHCTASPSSVPPPSTAEVTGKPDMSSYPMTRLAQYSDGESFTVSLALVGWQCTAMYGQDGSGGILVYPPAQSAPKLSWASGWHLSTGSEAQGVSVLQSGGSSTQAAVAACPYFKAAATVVQSVFGRTCTQIPGETVTPISDVLAYFTDPIGVAGMGDPSGGKLAAVGVVTYRPSAVPTTYRITCTLPSSERDLCADIIDYFVGRYGEQGASSAAPSARSS